MDGREHLKQVFRKAFWGAHDLDDGDEIIPYRGAVCALLAGVGTMVGWLWLMGAQLWVAAVFIGLALLIFIRIAGIVAEAGLAAVRSPMIAPDLMIHGLGVNLIGTSGVFNLSLAYIWCADIRIFVMALLANGLKLVEDMTRPSRRVVMCGVCLAILIGAAGSCWMCCTWRTGTGGSIWWGGFLRAGRQPCTTTRCAGWSRRVWLGTDSLFALAVGRSCSY